VQYTDVHMREADDVCMIQMQLRKCVMQMTYVMRKCIMHMREADDVCMIQMQLCKCVMQMSDVKRKCKNVDVHIDETNLQIFSR
jgi:hypothetical protein